MEQWSETKCCPLLMGPEGESFGRVLWVGADFFAKMILARRSDTYEDGTRRKELIADVRG